MGLCTGSSVSELVLSGLMFNVLVICILVFRLVFFVNFSVSVFIFVFFGVLVFSSHMFLAAFYPTHELSTEPNLPMRNVYDVVL